MSDNAEVQLPELDEDPSSGEFIEHDELELTEDEVADGNHLGEAIDPNDDNDTGTV